MERKYLIGITLFILLFIIGYWTFNSIYDGDKSWIKNPWDDKYVNKHGKTHSKSFDHNGNMTIEISLISDKTPIDIDVYVDDSLQIQGKYKRGRRNFLLYVYRMQLEEGEHTIKVKSRKGKTEIIKDFEILSKLTCRIQYWNLKEEKIESLFKVDFSKRGFMYD